MKDLRNAYILVRKRVGESIILQEKYGVSLSNGVLAQDWPNIMLLQTMKCFSFSTTDG
jgi:hypothetical protein